MSQGHDHDDHSGLFECEYCHRVWDGNAQCPCTTSETPDVADAGDHYYTQFDMDVNDNVNEEGVSIILNRECLLSHILGQLPLCSDETLVKIRLFLDNALYE